MPAMTGPAATGPTGTSRTTAGPKGTPPAALGPTGTHPRPDPADPTGIQLATVTPTVPILGTLPPPGTVSAA